MRMRLFQPRVLVLLLPVIAVATVVAPLPSYIPFGDPRPTLAFLNAQLALVAIWVALGMTPVCFRWPCGYLALCAACWPLIDPAPTPVGEAWRIYLMWDVAPHALLTFTLLCILRARGMRIEREAPRADQLPRRPFTLRRVFGWITAAVFIAAAWLQLRVAARSVPWPAWEAWQLVVIGMLRGLSLTVFDLATLWAVLRPGRIRWRLAMVALLIVSLQLLLWLYAEAAVADQFIRKWRFKLDEMAWFDLGYFGPMLAALFLVRSGGHRWTASQSLSP